MKKPRVWPTSLDGQRGPLEFRAVISVSNREARNCSTCSGTVHRSWRTGILHKDCFGCRYLKMIYGPSITVRRLDE